MSLFVVEREEAPWLRPFMPRFGRQFYAGPLVVPEIRDCNEHDGEWPAFIRLAHETVEWEGRAVPLFEGDLERREWEARRRARRRP